MSEREDKKLESVVLARFQYRHEAEFAAGFLDDAGIPYRLQVDDAAMGMTIATPATLWVRGMDLREARELLGAGTSVADGEPGPGPEVEWDATAEPGTAPVHDDEALAAGAFERTDATPRARDRAYAERRPESVVPAGPPRGVDEVVVGRERQASVDATRLTAFERILALALCVAGIGGATVVSDGPGGAVWAGVLVALSVPMATGALLGRTISPARRLLRAISGSA